MAVRHCFGDFTRGVAPDFSFFFFNDTATTEIYTLSLHDALPICPGRSACSRIDGSRCCRLPRHGRDRKSTRLNSSHSQISYAVFCLKKKKTATVPSLLLTIGGEPRRTRRPSARVRAVATRQTVAL